MHVHYEIRISQYWWTLTVRKDIDFNRYWTFKEFIHTPDLVRKFPGDFIAHKAFYRKISKTLERRHNGLDSFSNHQPHDCLLNRLFSGDQRKHQSSASLAFVRGIHRGPVNSPHKWPVTRKMFPFDDVIMSLENAGLGVKRGILLWNWRFQNEWKFQDEWTILNIIFVFAFPDFVRSHDNSIPLRFKVGSISTFITAVWFVISRYIRQMEKEQYVSVYFMNGPNALKP